MRGRGSQALLLRTHRLPGSWAAGAVTAIKPLLFSPRPLGRNVNALIFQIYGVFFSYIFSSALIRSLQDLAMTG